MILEPYGVWADCVDGEVPKCAGGPGYRADWLQGRAFQVTRPECHPERTRQREIKRDGVAAVVLVVVAGRWLGRRLAQEGEKMRMKGVGGTWERERGQRGVGRAERED